MKISYERRIYELVDEKKTILGSVSKFDKKKIPGINGLIWQLNPRDFQIETG